jgi:hypothetical protein
MSLKLIRKIHASTIRYERWAFLLLLMTIAFPASVMMWQGAWSGGPGLTQLPKPGDSSAGASLMLFYTLQASIGITAVLMRAITFRALLCVSLLSAPTVLIYLSLVSSIGFGAPAVQVDEFARVILAGLAGLLLLAPWIIRRMRWPARTPGHLAIGISITATAMLQFIFHMILVIPGSEISFDAFEKAEAAITLTSSPEELERFIDLDLLPLRPIDLANLKGDLEASGVINASSVATGVDRILADRPHALYSWRVPGESKIDRILIAYDGRADNPKLWVLPSSAFLLPRLTAISAYYFLTGLSGFVWMAGALLVHYGHSRRRGASPHQG